MNDINDIIVRKFAIFALRPDAQWYFTDDESIVWLDESQTEPTTAEIDAHIESTQYIRDREAEYPSIAELTVALYDTSDKAALVAKRAAVKLKYPKP